MEKNAIRKFPRIRRHLFIYLFIEKKVYFVNSTINEKIKCYFTEIQDTRDTEKP